MSNSSEMAALRERLARLIEPYYWHEGLDEVAREYPDQWIAKKRASSLEKADAILAEIEAAGWRLVPADRWERVRRVAEWTQTAPAIDATAARPMVMPGDLDGDV